MPVVMAGEARLAMARSVEALKQGTYFGTPEGAWVRPPEGLARERAAYRYTALASGVQIVNASYITVRNLTCEGFHNDGFNVHGECQGIFCEGIVGRFNGDDGFSIHEDISAVVRNGRFHNNLYGIQDVNASRSAYFGVQTDHNAVCGISMHGGIHLVVDALSRDNPVQVAVTSGNAKHIGLSASNVGCVGLTLLKNVVALGGKAALQVTGKGRVVAGNCVFGQAETGVTVTGEALCHLTHSVVFGCQTAEISLQSPNVEMDGNVYHPGRFVWGKQTFAASQWDAFRKATGQDKASRLLNPTFDRDGSWRLEPKVTGVGRWKTPVGLTRPAYSRPESGKEPTP